jgi:hypothetical protein
MSCQAITEAFSPVIAAKNRKGLYISLLAAPLESAS